MQTRRYKLKKLLLVTGVLCVLAFGCTKKVDTDNNGTAVQDSTAVVIPADTTTTN